MAKKQIPSDIRYWEKRRELEDKARLKMEDDMIKTLTKNLTEALEKIQAQLLAQADLHNMTQQELLEDYSLRDQKKYKKYVDENYKELMKSDEAYQEFIDEFFPSYDYAKVNRLLQMRSDIFNTLASEMIKTDPNKKFNDGLEEIINKMYNSNSNALMYLLGPGDFNPLPKKELNSMLNYPWSGKTFSNRLWGNISRLEQNLSNAIVNSVSSGQGVVEALKMMRNDSSISDMFKLEEKKFKNAIENLVRTEYAHFAVEGLKKSVHDAGIKDMQAWSAEDERVCSICGERHGKLIKDDWFPPYHGRCRCTAIPKMPELGEDIDKLYDEMFGDLLDEFAKDRFGIKLNKPKKVKGDTIDLGKGMLESIGKDNYDEFHKTLNSLPEGDLKEIFRKHGEKLGFVIHKEKSFADRNVVNVTQEAFGSSDTHNKMEVVYHEIGHAFDNLGVKITTGKDTYETGLTRKVRILKKTKRFAIEGTHMSSLPKYELKEKIRSDLWNYIYQGEKPYEKGKWPEYTKIDELISNLKSEYTKKDLTGVSDMLESTGWTSRMPLGTGHGTKYWDRYGMAETEFFAHATEIAMNKEAGKIFKEIFSESYATYEQMLKDILKGG